MLARVSFGCRSRSISGTMRFLRDDVNGVGQQGASGQNSFFSAALSNGLSRARLSMLTTWGHLSRAR